MERFTISLDEKLASEFDRLIRERGYQNHSEAVRDILRGQLNTLHAQEDRSPFCVANLSYVYNHHERDLAERLIEIQHQSRPSGGFNPRPSGSRQLPGNGNAARGDSSSTAL